MIGGGIEIAAIVGIMMTETAITGAIGIALDPAAETTTGGDPPRAHEAAKAVKTMIITDTVVRSAHIRLRNVVGILVAIETENILIAIEVERILIV